MEDPDSKLPEAQTQPPTRGLERLGALAQEFQALAQGLTVEWTRADEGRAALAQVLVERQTQREEDQGRIAELQGQLASLAEAQAERERLKSELEAQASKLSEQSQALDAERARAQEERAALEAESARERTRTEELQARLAELEQAAAAEREARAEQDKAAAAEREARDEQLKAAEAERQRVQDLQATLEAREKELQTEREARAAEQKELLAERAARAEEQKAAEQRRDEGGTQARERAELEAARDQARRELDELKMQVEGLMRQADGERGRWQEERAGIAAERYKALSESAQLRARVEELEQAAAAPRPEAATLPAAADTAHEELRAQVSELEIRLRAAEAQAEAERAERQNGLRALERSGEEVATLKAECSLLQEKLDVVERSRVAAEHGRTLAEGERDRARSESSPLWGTIESLQHQIHQERERFEDMMSKGPAGSPDDLRALEERLAEQTSRAQEAAAAVGRAQAELKALRERESAQQPALKSTLAALRRTPFVSPTLRVAMDGLESHAEHEPRRNPRTQRLLFLDRDPLSVEALAQDLEQHGAEVLVAHYAEEVSFFLKTSEARNVNALVADVMAFKSDQDMIERCRAWRQDLPSAALVVSYRTDNPIEAERARHVPGNLGAINVSRTVGREALLETLAKRPAKAEPPSGVFRLFKR